METARGAVRGLRPSPACARARRRPVPALVPLAFALGLALPAALSADPPPTPASSDDLYDSAKQLFDQVAPPEVKEQVDFPSREQFDAFLAKLEAALRNGSLQDLAQYEPQARAVLAVLRASPETAGEADWLAARLDEIEAAGAIARTENTAAASQPTQPGPAPAPSAAPPAPAPPAALPREIPYYDVWYRRLRSRPEPPNAPELMPRLRSAFAAEGAPAGLAWLAEVESSLNPEARSPSGARGLYQLEASTAKSLGLSTFMPDERTDPDKSARAAARELVALRERFGSWPLAIAAYNVGEFRVSRALASRHADSYAAIASSLPAGTRMYVPKVCALVAVRTGRELEP